MEQLDGSHLDGMGLMGGDDSAAAGPTDDGYEHCSAVAVGGAGHVAIAEGPADARVVRLYMSSPRPGRRPQRPMVQQQLSAAFSPAMIGLTMVLSMVLSAVLAHCWLA